MERNYREISTEISQGSGTSRCIRDLRVTPHHQGRMWFSYTVVVNGTERNIVLHYAIKLLLNCLPLTASPFYHLTLSPHHILNLHSHPLTSLLSLQLSSQPHTSSPSPPHYFTSSPTHCLASSPYHPLTSPPFHPLNSSPTSFIREQCPWSVEQGEGAVSRK